MSQLSNRDFYKEFGQNILIHPFIRENIKGASINLTVSKWAWDLSTKKLLVSFERKIEHKIETVLIVPPFSSVGIMTQEIIYVGKNICGTYHSKVGMVTQGFSNISTTLDPEYIGTSLICVHNNFAVQQELIVGKTFASLMLNYVSNPVFDEMVFKPNMPGQRDRVSAYENGNIFIKEQRDDGCHDNPKALKKFMIENNSFKEWKKEFWQGDIVLKKKKTKKVILLKIGMYITISVIILLLGFVLIKIIDSVAVLGFLKSYVPLVVFFVGFGISEPLKKLISFIEGKVETKWS